MDRDPREYDLPETVYVSNDVGANCRDVEDTPEDLLPGPGSSIIVGEYRLVRVLLVNSITSVREVEAPQEKE